MMAARRSTFRVKPRQRSMRCQRLRCGPKSCCGEKIYARIEELINTKRNLPDSQSCEAVYSRFLSKFTQYRPRIKSVKTRLQESYELLSEVDELLEFFCDPRRLWAYLLEERPQPCSETSDQSSRRGARTSSENDAPQRRESLKNISCESYCSKKPEIDTIAEEAEEGPPAPAYPEQKKLSEGIPAQGDLRDSGLLSHVVSQLASSQKQTPESASFAMPRYDRTEILSTVAWNKYSKRFKTSTPAEQSPSLRLSPPRISLIAHHKVQHGRQRRKAMMIEPPEEDGGWMGTPVIRNPPSFEQSRKNNGERLKRLSLNSTENSDTELVPNIENQLTHHLAPTMPLRRETENVEVVDGGSIRKALGQEQECPDSEAKPHTSVTVAAERPRRTARANAIARTLKPTTKKVPPESELDYNIDGKETIEPALPALGTVVEKPRKNQRLRTRAVSCQETLDPAMSALQPNGTLTRRLPNAVDSSTAAAKGTAIVSTVTLNARTNASSRERR